MNRLRAAIADARAIARADVPPALQGLVDGLDDLEALLSTCEEQAERAAASEARLEEIVDHLHVMEIAMTSVSQARDDASTALDDARRAAGVSPEASIHTGLRDRVRELVDERDRASSEIEGQRALLEAALERIEAVEGRAGGSTGEEGATALVERLRAALRRP